MQNTNKRWDVIPFKQIVYLHMLLVITVILLWRATFVDLKQVHGKRNPREETFEEPFLIEDWKGMKVKKNKKREKYTEVQWKCVR